MKRVVLLILALLLLSDLAEDGCFGKAQFIPPHSTATISLTSLHHYASGQVDSSDSLLSTDFQDMYGLRQSRQVIQRGQLPLKIITLCNKGSSGGISR